MSDANRDDETKAFSLAKEAAMLDFSGAISGLLAGHAAEIKRMERDLTNKDLAFLMALALTEKGARLDRSGVMAQKIADGLHGVSLCKAEKNFLSRVSK